MTGPEITIRGVNELARDLHKFDPDMLEVLKDSNQQVSEHAAGYVRAEAPVRSGALAGTVRVGRTARSAVVKIGSARVPYAGPINYGWRAHNIEPNPFIERAKDRALPELAALVERKLRDLADKIHGA